MRIHEVARLAGVTPRAVRHYHRCGALPEPERESNGYRQYGTDDLVRLLRVRSLIDAGMPVRRIGALGSGTITVEERDDLLRTLRARRDELDGCISRLESMEIGPSDAHAEAVAALEEMAAAAHLDEQALAVERNALALLAAHDAGAPALALLAAGYRAVADDPSLTMRLQAVATALAGLDEVPAGDLPARSADLARQIGEVVPGPVRELVATMPLDPHADVAVVAAEPWLVALVPQPATRAVLARVILLIRDTRAR